MLGMGDDGHTASLFPKTYALHALEKKVASNFISKLDAWRMTLTCVNKKSAGKSIMQTKRPLEFRNFLASVASS